MSTATPTRHPDLSLYDEDFYAWAMTTAALLRQRRFAEIDIAHLAEELEDMGKRERRALESHIRNVTLHFLKWRYQPEKRRASWRQSVRNGRIEIQNFCATVRAWWDRSFKCSTTDIQPPGPMRIDETGLSEETFSAQCPFTAEQMLDTEFWPG